MRNLLLILATLSLLSFSDLKAQKDLNGLFSVSTFYSPTEGSYVETYLKVFNQSANMVKTEDGTYQASLKVLIYFKQDGEIIEWKNYNLLSEKFQDTVNIQSSFLDLQRISLEPGIYQLELHVSDNNGESTPLEFAQVVSLEYNDTELAYSGIQLVEKYARTVENNILTKHGFDLVPYVGDFYDQYTNALSFYTELYNCDDKLEKDEDFLFRYYIESFETKIALSEYQRFQRQKAGGVNILFASLPIQDLPSGNYFLVVEANDKNDKELLSSRIFFMKSNPQAKLNMDDLNSVDITATFAEKITDHDSLKFYVQSLTPIAAQNETKHINYLSEDGKVVQLQKFLYNFWKEVNQSYPAEEWEIYKREVLRVENSFKTHIRHGFETDQGRIWLKYGRPDDIEISVHESAEYPYVIWQYNHALLQNNLKFLFYNPHLVGTEYYLAYTNARGETYDPSFEGLNTRGQARSGNDGAFWGNRMGSKINK